MTLESLRTFMAGEGRPSPVPRRSNVVVLGAGKGGVGTSVSAFLLALAASRRGTEVLLIEADEHVASLPLLAGLDVPVPGIGALRQGGRDLSDLLVRIAPNLTLLPGGGGGAEATLTRSLGERRVLYRRVTTLYDRYPLVIVDGGARLDSVIAAAAPGADRLLAVTSTDRVALAGAHALLKVAIDRLPRLPVELLAVAPDEESGRAAHGIATTAARGFLGLDLPFAGTIPVDPEVTGALDDDGLIALDDDGSALDAADRLARRLVEPAPAVTGSAVLPLRAAF